MCHAIAAGTFERCMGCARWRGPLSVPKLGGNFLGTRIVVGTPYRVPYYNKVEGIPMGLHVSLGEGSLSATGSSPTHGLLQNARTRQLILSL